MPSAASAAEELDHTRLVADWSSTRAGARSARGFHFQDVVGAWLASRVATGTLSGSLVPEGFDDLSLEGPACTNYQVKSRQERLGPFPLHVAVDHILDAWVANGQRERPADRLVVALERGLLGHSDHGPEAHPDGAPIDPTTALGAALTKRARNRGLDLNAQMPLFASMRVLGVNWDQLETLIDENLAGLAPGVPDAGRRLLARSLTATMASATDHNAAADHPERRILDRTSIVDRIQRDAEQIDVAALQAALVDGLCEVLDYAPFGVGADRFYEGLATQPGHVTAGLVALRPELVAEVISAVEESQAVILKGPSGVGKSAVLWTVPLAMRGVLWFRVRRLNDPDDAVLLSRLARAYGAAADHPVGFLVDGAGSGSVRAWSLLREQLAGHDGVVLVASARNEDLLQLGDLGGCATIEVALGERVAQAIYEGLVRRGATAEPHWRAAFDKADGLTLEFTHILSRGRRLREVIDDQIATRVREQRTTELELLALVSVAHRWGASLDVTEVAEQFAADELRPAVQRLADEHLLVERDGVLFGLHPIRSEAIAESVHSIPPPTWSGTIKRVLSLLDDDQLTRFISQLLRDQDNVLPTVVEFGLTVANKVRRLACVLEGLRLWDTQQQVRGWVDLMVEADIPPSVQMGVVLLAVGGSDLGDLTPQPVIEVLDQMAEVGPGAAQDELIATLTWGHLRRLLFSASPADAHLLLAALAGSSTVSAMPASIEPCELTEGLARSAPEVLADVLAVACDCNVRLADELVRALGGEEFVLSKLQTAWPWLLEIDVQVEGGERVGFARLLHLSDEVHESAHDRVVALARVLLRTLPSIDRTDVKVLLPGRQPYVIGDFELGSTGLVRRNDHNEAEVARNRAKLAIARSLVGQSDSERLAAATPVIRDLAAFVREFGNRWVRRDASETDRRRLHRERERLAAAAHQIRRPLGSATVPKDDGFEDNGLTDRLGFIAEITDNAVQRLLASDGRPALIAFLTETVLPGISDAENEPWHLLGDTFAVVDSLNQLAEAIARIALILRKQELGDAARRAVLESARNASRSTALAAAARPIAADLATDREARRSTLEAALRSSAGLRFDLLAEHDDRVARFALVLEVPTLFAWPEWLERVLEAVQQHRVDHEHFLIVPTRRGERIDGLAVNLIETASPASDVGSWAELLPPVRGCPLAASIDAAISALQWLSGLNDLTLDQRRHGAATSMEARARAAYRSAMSDLESFSGDVRDRAIEMIDRWAVWVENEAHGIDTESTFAATVVAGYFGGSNEVVEEIVGLRFAAHEWEIDPEGVRRLMA